jgi:hypothetical protein
MAHEMRLRMLSRRPETPAAIVLIVCTRLNDHYCSRGLTTRELARQREACATPTDDGQVNAFGRCQNSRAKIGEGSAHGVDEVGAD